MMKRVDVAAYNALKEIEAGEFKGEVKVYDLKGNGVSLPENNPNLSEEILKTVEEFTAKIISGEIVVNKTPKTAEEDARVIGKK